MSSHQTSASGRLYRDQTHLPARKPQLNGKTRAPSSSSGAVSRVSKSTGHQTKDSALLPSPRPGPRAPQSELRTSFDPMKDFHLWTMWRVAVNGRIMDEVRERNQRSRPQGEQNSENDIPFGRSLVKTPLDRFVRVENGSHTLATLMMDPHGEGGSKLQTKQFVFYGLPRVVLKKTKRTLTLPNDDPD